MRSRATAACSCAALMLAVASNSTVGAADSGSAARIVLTQIPAIGGAGLLPGSRVVLVDPAIPETQVTNLTPGFDAAGRPDLSFDGRRVLFVGRREAGDTLDVWELEIDGGNPRRVTRRSDDVTQAIYLSTLYTLDADEPHRRIAFCAAGGEGLQPGHPCAALYTSRLDGSRARQITFNPDGVGDPLLLSDGRLLFSGARPPDFGGGTTLFTVNTDGTDVSVFAAAHGVPAIRGMPCETDDGHVVYVESSAAGSSLGGSLVEVERTRSLRTGRSVTSGQGAFRSPSALPDGRLLVSYRPAAGGTFGVYTIDRMNGPRLTKTFDAPGWDDVDPLAVRPRSLPKGRSSVVDERVEYGFLYCLDAYISDREAASDIASGAIANVRLHRPAADVEGATTGTSDALLGEVPVRADGSFYLQVPAQMPLRLETLDPAGERLQAMESWIWVMPNERRGCIGCHEDRELTPPNRHVQALRGVPQRVGLGEEREVEADVDRPANKGYP